VVRGTGPDERRGDAGGEDDHDGRPEQGGGGASSAHSSRETPLGELGWDAAEPGESGRNRTNRSVLE
jgi:hypothetical protein